MAVAFRNLTGDVQAKLSGSYPDIGQTFYLVDGNYRTSAQGWGKADRTGPLDLWSERNPGYVYRTTDYTSDSVAIQAAIDAQVDFRGDALYYTPGAYAVATALAVNVPDARWLGSPVGTAQCARASITATVAAAIAITAAADRMEVAFLRFVPLTTSHIVAIADGANFQHWHHFFYDANGVAADLGTQMFLIDGTWDDTVLEDFTFSTDAAQGPLIELDGSVTNLTIQRFMHLHNAGTLACSLLSMDGLGTTSVVIGPGHGQIGGGGIVTGLVNHGNMTENATNATIRQFTGSVGYATNATLIPAASAAAEVDFVDSWLATIGGGAGRAAYIGTS
jgi:hypothetical protein